MTKETKKVTKKESTSKNTKTVPQKENKEKKVVKKETTVSSTKNGSKGKRQEVYHTSNSKSDEITKLVEVILVILVIFAAFYLITSWVTKSQKTPTVNNNNNKAEEKIIQYDEILLGNLLSQPSDEYYVLLMDENDSNVSYYESQIATYEEKENHLRVYTARLGNSFNKKYKSEESFLSVDTVKNLKVKGATLFKIKDHRVEEAVEGTDAIVQKLGELIK